MKTTKIMISTIIMISLFLSLLGTAVATDVTIILHDERGDVINEYGEFVNQPNIDILQLTLIKEGTSIEIELIVDGEIENRGDLETFRIFMGDFEFDDDSELEEYLNWLFNTTIDLVAYYFQIFTDTAGYSIYYVNNEVYVGDIYSQETIDAEFSVNEDTLTISFDINDESERIYDIFGLTTKLFGDTISEEFEGYEDEIFLEPLNVLIQVPNIGEVNEPVQFTAEGAGGQQPYTYEWDFGDGATSTQQNPTHIYTNDGEYEVSVIVTDRLGDSDTQTRTIEIIGESPSTPGFEILTLLVSILAIMIALFIVKRKK